MTNLLDVRTVAFDVLGYPMCWLELVGTVLYLASVVLIARRNMLTWPIGIVAVVLYAMLFWQIRLYSDALEQAWYFVASLYGWWSWARARTARSEPVPVAFSSPRILASTAALTGALCVVAGACMSRVHEWLPTVFPAPADFPWLDASTTVASFVAMWLTARRRVESWIYWIVVDVVGIGLYLAKDVKFVALLYVVLLALAVLGLLQWASARTRAAVSSPGGAPGMAS